MLKKWKSQEIFIELKAEEEISKHNPEKTLKQQKRSLIGYNLEQM